MEKTKAIILAHQESHNEFKYYFSVIQIAEESINTKPDVTIDCCKSLIEGICKSILIRLDNNYHKNNDLVDGVKALKLFDKALKQISKYDQSLIGRETDFLLKSRDLVETIINIRNDRGDISHGKFSPKPNEIISTSEFSIFVINMTDSILSFMLKIFFDINIPTSGILDFTSEDMEAYNNWLDESLEFPIKKAQYSKLLFENDYDEYESRYYDEFLKSKEDDSSEKSYVQVELDTNEDFSSFDSDEESPVESPDKDSFEQLVNKFHEDAFWNDEKTKMIQKFALDENLKFEELKKLINKYLFTNKEPLRDEVAKTMLERPRLTDYKVIINSLIEKIVAMSSVIKE